MSSYVTNCEDGSRVSRRNGNGFRPPPRPPPRPRRCVDHVSLVSFSRGRDKRGSVALTRPRARLETARARGRLPSLCLWFVVGTLV